MASAFKKVLWDGISGDNHYKKKTPSSFQLKYQSV